MCVDVLVLDRVRCRVGWKVDKLFCRMSDLYKREEGSPPNCRMNGKPDDRSVMHAEQLYDLHNDFFCSAAFSGSLSRAFRGWSDIATFTAWTWNALSQVPLDSLRHVPNMMHNKAA